MASFRIQGPISRRGAEARYNVELRAIRDRRVDMPGETGTGELVHVELRSTNQSHMPRRMLEYSVGIHRQFGRFPEQAALYVGTAPLRMKSRLVTPRGIFASDTGFSTSANSMPNVPRERPGMALAELTI